jgi:hypothetical protein
MTRNGIEQLLSRPSDLGNVAVVNDDTERICDTDVPVGRVARIVAGLEIPAAEVTRLEEHLESGDLDSMEVTLVARPEGGEATIVYLNHIPPEERAQYAQFLRPQTATVEKDPP